MHSSPPRILLIEDNEDDVFLLRRALKKALVEATIDVLEDGQQAMDYFEAAVSRVKAGKNSLPDLVLLDLKLPFVLGIEVLSFIRSRPELKNLNVIVLTSSAEARDQEKAVELQAHGYHVKPPTPEMVAEVSRVLTARV